MNGLFFHAYSTDSIKIKNDAIMVTIPFNWMNEMSDKVGDKITHKLNLSQTKVLAEIRNNPNISKPQLAIKCNLEKTSIDNIILDFKKAELIERKELDLIRLEFGR